MYVAVAPRIRQRDFTLASSLTIILRETLADDTLLEITTSEEPSGAGFAPPSQLATSLQDPSEPTVIQVRVSALQVAAIAAA